jgi:hypothetical protein
MHWRDCAVLRLVLVVVVQQAANGGAGGTQLAVRPAYCWRVVTSGGDVDMFQMY